MVSDSMTARKDLCASLTLCCETTTDQHRAIRCRHLTIGALVDHLE